MTAPILLCGFNDQSDPSIGIVINEVDGCVMYQNGLPPKLSGGTCDFTNPYNCYSYLPATSASAFSLSAASPKLTVEASINLLSTDSLFVVGKSGVGYVTYANWECGIIDGKLNIVASASGSPGSLYCNIASSSLSTGQHHIAFVFDGQSVVGYLDGIAVMQGTCSGMPADGNPGVLYIGTQPGQSTYRPRGVIVDEIRITRDVVYSGPFTPPAPGSMSSYVYPAIPVQQATESSVWSNEETPEQAWPGETAIQTEIDGTFAPIRVFVGNGIDMPTRSDYGYIEGAITRRGDVAPAHIVACFDSGFNLIDTVTSGISGEYRFDNLPLQASYMIVAMDNAAYTYNPAAADRRTPRAYS